MTDDLVRLARKNADRGGYYSDDWTKLADRIEKLEAALREIINKDSFNMDWAIRTARKALEDK